MLRAILKTLLICTYISTGTDVSADDTFPSKVWAQRVLDNLETILKDPELDDEKVQFEIGSACQALAIVDSQAAIELARTKLERINVGFRDIVLAQSSTGDIDGAFKTVELIKIDYLKSRALSLIASRQCWTGDFEDARATITRMTTAGDIERARANLARDLIEHGHYAEAVAEYKLLSDEDQKERVRDSAESEKNRADPGDADYEDKRVHATISWRSTLGISEDDIELVRLESQAHVAIHRKDRQAFEEAVQTIRKLTAGWEKFDRANAMFLLANLHAEHGDRESARRCFQEGFDVFFGGENPIETNDYLRLVGGHRFRTSAPYLSDAQLKKLHGRLVRDPGPFTLGAFAGALSENSKYDSLETLYQETESAPLRFEFVVGTLFGFEEQIKKQLQAKVRRPSVAERMNKIALLQPILTDKKPIELDNTGTQRPKQKYLGLYNVPDIDSRGLRVWREAGRLPELSEEEFHDVRFDLALTLWSHGAVADFTSNGKHMFYIWDDKYSDRTQKVEIQPTPLLDEILPEAIAEVQQLLKKHPRWRVMFPGTGSNPKEEFFVVYPDAIRIAQSKDTDNIVDAIRENAKLRIASQEKANSKKKAATEFTSDQK